MSQRSYGLSNGTLQFSLSASSSSSSLGMSKSRRLSSIKSSPSTSYGFLYLN